MTRRDMIEFAIMNRLELLDYAKEQLSIFPEDCYTGRIFREYIRIFDKDKELIDREELLRSLAQVPIEYRDYSKAIAIVLDAPIVGVVND